MTKSILAIVLLFSLNSRASDLGFWQMIDIVFNKSNTLDLHPMELFKGDMLPVLTQKEYDTFISDPMKILKKYKKLSNLNFDGLYIFRIVKNGTVYYRLTKSLIFQWRPTKEFLKQLPSSVTRYTGEYTVKLLRQFHSKDNSKLSVVFFIEYDTFPTMILSAKIDVKTKKVLVPLRYTSSPKDINYILLLH